jgi:hypothetical protein
VSDYLSKIDAPKHITFSEGAGYYACPTCHTSMDIVHRTTANEVALIYYRCKNGHRFAHNLSEGTWHKGVEEIRS